MKLLLLVVLGCLLIFQAVRTSSEHTILETVLLYRKALHTLDPYPATRKAQDVEPSNQRLYAVFVRNREYYESLLSKHISTKLLPGYVLPKICIKMVPIDFMKLMGFEEKGVNFYQKDLTMAPMHQRTALRMCIEQWNRHLDSFPCISKRLAGSMQGNQINTGSVLRNQLQLGKALFSNLVSAESSVIREDIIFLFHGLEYLRHLMCLGWNEATNTGFVDELSSMWNVFVQKIQSRKQLSYQMPGLKNPMSLHLNI